MSGIVGVFAVALATLGAWGWLYGVLDKRSRAMLARWAESESLSLLTAKMQPFLKGPYWYASKGQMVYRITVSRPDGSERSGWARCGSPLRGALVDRVAIKWDDDATEAQVGNQRR